MQTILNLTKGLLDAYYALTVGKKFDYEYVINASGALAVRAETLGRLSVDNKFIQLRRSATEIKELTEVFSHNKDFSNFGYTSGFAKALKLITITEEQYIESLNRNLERVKGMP